MKSNDHHLVSPTPSRIVMLKEDTVAGVRQVGGFEFEEAAVILYFMASAVVRVP